MSDKAQGQLNTGIILSVATGAFGFAAFAGIVTQDENALIFGSAFAATFVLNALTKNAYHRTTQEAVNIYNDTYHPKTGIGFYWEIGASQNGIGLHLNF